jgi:hypothetical protein
MRKTEDSSEGKQLHMHGKTRAHAKPSKEANPGDG